MGETFKYLNCKVHHVSYILIAFVAPALIYFEAAKTCISILLKKKKKTHSQIIPLLWSYCTQLG